MAKAPLSLLLVVLAACYAPVAPSQRLTESAFDMNSATRWGRMDVAMEHVGAEAREAFGKQHARWGRSIRIVDLEFNGMSLKNKGSEAEVIVTLSWQRLDEADVRMTSIAQRWVDLRGKWSLLSEDEKSGDGGLLDEEPKAKALPAEAAPKERGRYQTRVIGAPEE